MIRVLAAFAVSSFFSVALACGADGKCGGACAMSGAPAATSTAAVDQAAGTKLTLAVTGMSCGACAAKIEAALKGIKGVNAAAVDHASGTAKVAFDASLTNADALLAAVKGLGKYGASVAAAPAKNN